MTSRTVCLAVCLVLTAAAAAQKSSPAGFLSVSGRSDAPFGQLKSNYHTVDATHLGTAFAVGSVAFRRHLRSTSEPGTTVDVFFRMGNGVPLGRIFGDLSRNYTTKPTTFVNRTKVALPNWTKPLTSSPAPFDFRLSFGSKFVYAGRTPLAWEVEFDNARSKNGIPNRLALDAVVRRGGVARASAIRVACKNWRSLDAFASTFAKGTKSTGITVNVGPSLTQSMRPGSSVLMSVDTKLSRFDFGWCTPLLVAPTWIVPMGIVNRNWIQHVTFNAPYSKQLVGVQFHAQQLGIAATGRIALSGAVSVGLPKANDTAGVDAIQMLSMPLALPYAASVEVGSVVMQMNP